MVSLISTEQLQHEIDRLTAKNERLTAENERLTAENQRIHDDVTWFSDRVVTLEECLDMHTKHLLGIAPRRADND